MKYLEEFKEYCEEVSRTKKDAQEFLIRCGIHNSDGSLNAKYKTG